MAVSPSIAAGHVAGVDVLARVDAVGDLAGGAVLRDNLALLAGARDRVGDVVPAGDDHLLDEVGQLGQRLRGRRAHAPPRAVPSGCPSTWLSRPGSNCTPV